MGGYGSSYGKTKGKCYYDTGGHKVTDKNAIKVAEYYIKRGLYVAFLQEKPPLKRADLSVNGVHVEVKGVTSLNPSTVAQKIRDGFVQTNADAYRYPPETHREGIVVIASAYSSYQEAYRIVSKAIQEGKRKNWIKGKVKLFHNGVMYDMN